MHAPARRVLLASLVGTTIKIFDFYIYGTAAVLVFPALFFWRPIGHGTLHRLRRSRSLFSPARGLRGVRSLRRSYRPQGDTSGRAAHDGIVDDRHRHAADLCRNRLAAPAAARAVPLRPRLRPGRRVGGAVLLATENAPPGKHAWYGMFPQLGAPLGFILSTGIFVAVTGDVERSNLAWGWRVPFLASVTLVIVGLYVRSS